MRRSRSSRGERSSMTDDLKKRGAQDRSRLAVEEEHEVRYWTKALGVSKEERASAVAKVGQLRRCGSARAWQIGTFAARRCEAPARRRPIGAADASLRQDGVALGSAR